MPKPKKPARELRDRDALKRLFPKEVRDEAKAEGRKNRKRIIKKDSS